MGLKESGLRGSLRSVSTEVGAIPDNVTNHWPMNEGSGSSVADNIGDETVSLNGASWLSDSKYEGGFATTYQDGDHWITDNPIDIRSQEQTVCVWIDDCTIPNNTFPQIVGTGQTNQGIVAGGWYVGFESDNTDSYAVQHGDSSGSTTNALRDVSGPDASTEDVFLAYSLDGETGNLFLYDNNGLVNSEIGQSERSTEGETELLGMMRDNGSRSVSGNVDTPFLSVDTALPQSDIDDIWNATRR